MKKVKVS